eukprot:scaffold500322_cov34-Prasinocladus_malaysianus.AAC.1
MAWHPLGAVILLVLEGGVMAMVDAALQPLLVVADMVGDIETTGGGALPAVDLSAAFNPQVTYGAIHTTHQ